MERDEAKKDHVKAGVGSLAWTFGVAAAGAVAVSIAPTNMYLVGTVFALGVVADVALCANAMRHFMQAGRQAPSHTHRV